MKVYFGSVIFQLIKDNALKTGCYPVLLAAPHREQAEQEAVAGARQAVKAEIIVRSVDLAEVTLDVAQELLDKAREREQAQAQEPAA
jgi:hypothetical protein